jgi:hypothetical protein
VYGRGPGLARRVEGAVAYEEGKEALHLHLQQGKGTLLLELAGGSPPAPLELCRENGTERACALHVSRRVENEASSRKWKSGGAEDLPEE